MRTPGESNLKSWARKLQFVAILRLAFTPLKSIGLILGTGRPIMVCTISCKCQYWKKMIEPQIKFISVQPFLCVFFETAYIIYLCTY